jgi:NADH:ubiquinone oxidoreductase subunit 3 (subunit A)
MLYNYEALLIFIAFAVFMPVSFILTAKLLSKKEPGNPVKNAPYESGEETIGDSRDVDNEYLPHFMIFLPFEIIIAVFILWSTVAREIAFGPDIAIVMLGVLATALSFVGYKLASG